MLKDLQDHGGWNGVRGREGTEMLLKIVRARLFIAQWVIFGNLGLMLGRMRSYWRILSTET